MLQGIVALVLLVVLVLGAQALRRRRPPPTELVPVVDGRFVLRYPARNGIVLAIAALFPTALVIALTLRAGAADHVGAVGYLLAGVVTLAGLGFAAYQVLYAFRSRYVVDDTGIERIGVVTRRRVSWRDVVRIAHNPHQSWFFVTNQRGKHLWISDELPGIAQFSDLALRRLPSPVLSDAPDVREVLEELAEPVRRADARRPGRQAPTGA